MTLSTRLNYCTVENLDCILVLLDQPVVSQMSTLCNACEIIHNLLQLESQNGRLKTRIVACLIKSGGILEHFVSLLDNPRTGQTLSIASTKALTTALAVIPVNLKVDFADNHDLINVVCTHLKPLSSLWKPQGCTTEAIKCLLEIVKNTSVEGSLSSEAMKRVKSYALECKVQDVMNMSTDLARHLGIDLNHAYESAEDEEGKTTIV